MVWLGRKTAFSGVQGLWLLCPVWLQSVLDTNLHLVAGPVSGQDLPLGGKRAQLAWEHQLGALAKMAVIHSYYYFKRNCLFSGSDMVEECKSKVRFTADKTPFIKGWTR